MYPAFRQTSHMIVQMQPTVEVEGVKSRADKLVTQFLKKLQNIIRAVNTECGTGRTRLGFSFTHPVLVCFLMSLKNY